MGKHRRLRSKFNDAPARVVGYGSDDDGTISISRRRKARTPHPQTTAPPRSALNGVDATPPLDFGDHGGLGDSFNDFETSYLPGRDGQAGLSSPGPAYNTEDKVISIGAVLVAKPLVQFYAWHRRMSALREILSEIPVKLDRRAVMRCRCLPIDQSTYHVRIIGHDGAFPASPLRPRAALDIAALRLAFGYAHALLDAFGAMYHNDGLRKLLRSASLWYAALQHYGTVAASSPRAWRDVRPAIFDDDLDLTFADLLHRCPACFYGLSDERRLKNIDLVQRSALPPAYFVSARQVEAVRQLMEQPVSEASTDTGPTFHACASNVLAADEKAAKAARGPCDITGLVGLCCRHDVPLLFCDIDTPGERHYFAVALLKYLCDAVPSLKHIGVLYDIGCRFSGKDSVTRIVKPRVSWAVSVFHVFGHSISCQILYSPRRTEGFGWSDGEGMERIWSALSNLIVLARSMSHGERRHVVERRLNHIGSQARLGLIITLKARLAPLKSLRTEALKIIRCSASRALLLHRYEMMSLSQKPWTPPVALRGLDPKLGHVLNSMMILRRRKVSQPVPPESELPLHQSLALQLLARLGSVRQGQQQVQGRHNRGERGTALIKNINKSLQAARTAAYELLPRLNEAVRDRKRTPHDPPFKPLQKTELFTDAAYRWVARETQQYSAWWANPIVAASIDAYEELFRFQEEHDRLVVERRSALRWLDLSFQAAFKAGTECRGSVRSDLVQVYLSWFPPNARKLFVPSALDNINTNLALRPNLDLDLLLKLHPHSRPSTSTLPRLRTSPTSIISSTLTPALKFHLGLILLALAETSAKTAASSSPIREVYFILLAQHEDYWAKSLSHCPLATSTSISRLSSWVSSNLPSVHTRAIEGVSLTTLPSQDFKRPPGRWTLPPPVRPAPGSPRAKREGSPYPLARMSTPTRSPGATNHCLCSTALLSRARRPPCFLARSARPGDLHTCSTASSLALLTASLAQPRTASTRDLIAFSTRHLRHLHATRQSALEHHQHHQHQHQPQPQPDSPYGLVLSSPAYLVSAQRELISSFARRIIRVFFAPAASGTPSGPDHSSAAHTRAVKTAPAPPSASKDTQGSAERSGR
ncbi:hypothetical protein V8E36_002952 [Tilletia maclaganii]